MVLSAPGLHRRGPEQLLSMRFDIETGFCTKCGKRLLPNEGQIHVANGGKIEILCCNCEGLGSPENLQLIEKTKPALCCSGNRES
jgi:hypothetical protein